VTGDLRVLLVEDNPGDARLIAELLREVEEPRFQLTRAGSLREALPLRHQAQAILLDLSLPDAHGVGSLETLLAAGTDIPVVILTGLADEALARRAVAGGAQDYLVKGDVTPALLARSILYAIERKRAEVNAKQAATARQAQWLADVSAVLTSSLEIGELGAAFARALVPGLAELVALDLVSEDGRSERVAVASASPAHAATLDALRHYPPAADHRTPGWDAIFGREPVLLAELGPAELDRLAPDSTWRRLVGELGVRSVLAVPLLVRDQCLGALSLALVDPARRFGADEQAMATEVARRAALAVENARLYRAARGALRAREDMVAVVSHDLRNPLNVVSLSLQFLRHHLPPELHKTLTRAERAAASMDRLLDDLLEVSRIEEGALRLDRERLDLSGLLTELVEQQRSLAGDKQQKLRLELAAGAVPVDVDRHRMAQVVANLIGNAVKFTPAGGQIEVRVHAPVDGRVAVSISDSGPGIPPASLPHVFDRYYQAEARGGERKRGAGLGLTIAKGLVEAHGGSIRASSAPGKGATFTFVLPVAAS
jgi:signal transduction histidine kinase/CheY-like chemotaxis protein